MAAAKVCIFGAVERELAPLRRRLAANAPSVTHLLTVTGVGKACAASAATAAILLEKPGLVLQIGSAGAYPDSGLKCADVVIATSEILADEGVLTPGGFLDLRDLQLPLLGDDLYNEIPTAFPPAALWEEIQSAVRPRYRSLSGRLLTVSTGSGTDARAAELARRWRPLAENMEGAAVALVCKKYRCPFIELRGIANFVGTRDRATWNMDAACEHAAEVAALLLRSPLLLKAS